ncbi:MAG: hypothetical protein IJF39_03340 [Clostridia bacterium]|nr:hypothetical protein [Clostridia bacterium]
MYKYEMHAHTHPCSGGGGDIIEHIDCLMEKGFSGMVITNHFYRGDTCIPRSLPWGKFVLPYAEDFFLGKKYAEGKDFDLLFGIEEHIAGGREILVYGITPAFLCDHPELKNADLKQYAEAVHRVGGMLFQAHPYRIREWIINPTPFAEVGILDGIEVYNGGNAYEENALAEAFAKEKGLRGIAGSDVHQSSHAGIGGICSKVRIRDNETLRKVLKSGEYTLYQDEQRRKMRKGE